MNHKHRISWLAFWMIAACILTVLLFSSLPAYSRPSGPTNNAYRSFGPVGMKNGRLSIPVANELSRTLVLVSPL